MSPKNLKLIEAKKKCDRYNVSSEVKEFVVKNYVHCSIYTELYEDKIKQCDRCSARAQNWFKTAKREEVRGILSDIARSIVCLRPKDPEIVKVADVVVYGNFFELADKLKPFLDRFQ